MALLTPRPLQHPFTLTQIRGLRLGQLVKVSGRVYTARDRVHKYLFDGGKCPVDLEDGAIYHCGPVATRKEGGWEILAAGPTTSIREEAYAPKLIEQYGLRVILGKGGMGPRTEEACARSGCVYLQTIGGAGPMLAAHVARVHGVYFLKEFGMAEAMWELELKDFPAIVAIDAGGRSLYRRIQQASRRVLRRLIEREEPFEAVRSGDADP